MPMKINETEVRLDFHIYAILNFDLLIGCPSEVCFQVKPSYGSRNEELGEIVIATPIPYPKSPMVMQHPKHDPFEKVKFISPFISHSCETKHPAPSLELKQCLSDQPTVVPENDRDSTLFPHDIFLTKENSYDMDISKAPTLKTEENDFTIEHESFSFMTPHVSCSHLESPEFVVLSVACYYEEDNHPSLLVSKFFRRMVVDVFVYLKFCKSLSSTVVLTLQLERYRFMLGGEAGNYTTIDSCRTKFPRSSLRP
jgi:hypothetical protein